MDYTIKHNQINLPRSRIIYDLCGGTGSWSKPYSDNGYEVRLIDVNSGQDIRWLRKPNDNVHGVLAAPPCTHFSIACNRLWVEKDADGRTLENIAIMDACIRFVFAANPVWWVLENPRGRIVEFLGEPEMEFNPCDYGDPYTKRTCLWGKFNRPKKRPVFPECNNFEDKQACWKTAAERSITPPGFAASFFEANP